MEQILPYLIIGGAFIYILFGNLIIKKIIQAIINTHAKRKETKNDTNRRKKL